MKGVRHAHRSLRIGYFSQHHVDQLDMNANSVELLASRFPGTCLVIQTVGIKVSRYVSCQSNCWHRGFQVRVLSVELLASRFPGTCLVSRALGIKVSRYVSCQSNCWHRGFQVRVLSFRLLASRFPGTCLVSRALGIQVSRYVSCQSSSWRPGFQVRVLSVELLASRFPGTCLFGKMYVKTVYYSKGHIYRTICHVCHIENTTRVPVGDDLSYNEWFLKRI